MPNMISPIRPHDSGDIEEKAARRAAALCAEALRLRTREEKNESAQRARMMEDEPGKAFSFALVDEVFRSHDAGRQAALWRRLLEEYGLPQFMTLWDRFLLQAGKGASFVLPGVVMPAVAGRMRHESRKVILDAEPGALRRHFAKRRAEGFDLNLNHLGEAVLGEEEAARRVQAVLRHLDHEAVDYVSVKISALFSQINLTAWDESLAAIKDRLRVLCRAAAQRGKFVNMDMEEYRDLELTLAAFRGLLEEPEFHSFSAGIVLQAYVPEAWAAQQELTDWARRRVEEGGAPVKLRLVKGANLAMEKVEAELHGWEAAPYATKEETDANFRRMLEFGCRAENASVVRLGVASHNLFDVALALELREALGTADHVGLEMLEGMASYQARAARAQAGRLLLYAPVVVEADFVSAMAYLVRRLDENTGADNFLRALFSLAPGTPAWAEQERRFRQGWRRRLEVCAVSRRNGSPTATQSGQGGGFTNEPDTDWTRAENRRALQESRASWRPEVLPPLPEMNAMLAEAGEAQRRWADAGLEHRAAVLRAAAEVMAQERFATLACLQHDGKKAPLDADAEVSEAIDFARYYALAGAAPEGMAAEPLGVVVVAPPWNFPYAIPCGGVLAALAAGNAVVLKPAPETVQTAWLLAKHLWMAGVPREVLRFFPCEDGEAGRALITHPAVACVVLTGGYETARLFQSWRPSLRLYAETSGKNALVVTASADREQAARDLVRSAFGHSGQKCSAASLGILEAEVYDDPVFRRQLRDAARSLPCGAAAQPGSVVTPLMREPEGALLRALTQLEPGESWLLEPRRAGGVPHLWTPGIKLGVQPGSFFHGTECFGPVLGLMRAGSLRQAIEWQNATGYGLTAGLHSLDHEEIALWSEAVQAGNLYINKPTTGAVVQRQPFGGWKRSCIGPGAKAGGPHYTHLFSILREKEERSLDEAARDFAGAWETYFSKEHDPSALVCEKNVLRFRPCRGVAVLLPVRDARALKLAEMASRLTGVPLHVIIAGGMSEAEACQRIREAAREAEFLRTASAPSDALLRAAHEAGLNWIDAPFSGCGRVELRYWLREQALSQPRHRYGQMPQWLPPERAGH